MTTLEKQGSTIAATLLIAGCCIGAGMLGLPVVGALAGFLPTTLAMVIVYFFATVTGLLLVEATLWFDHKVHLLSLAQFSLGKAGKWITWSFFLFLFYCLFVAYTSGGGDLATEYLSDVMGRDIPREVGIFLTAFLVGFFIYLGTHAVSYISRLFLFIMALSYGALIVLGLPHVQVSELLHRDWSASLATVPILFICFGYQNMIPTVLHYVKKNVRSIRYAIFFGNLIPFLVYSLWNFVILGMLKNPTPETLAKVVNQGEMVTGLLQATTQSESILFFVNVFSSFALLTPFLLCALAFVDFLKDGLKHFPPFFQRDSIAYALVLIPPTLFSIVRPHLFLSALGFAGGFIDAVLFGILPVLIVYVGRYVKHRRGPYVVPGGKPLLFVVLAFALAVVVYRLTAMIR